MTAAASPLINNRVALSGDTVIGSTRDGDGVMDPDDAMWVRLNDDFDKDRNGDDGEDFTDTTAAIRAG